MQFRDGVNYAKDYTFTRQQLGAIQPEEMKQCWMQLKVYGTPGPDSNPTIGRSSSLEYYKKALSYFMPNRLLAWNVTGVPPFGNPTRSIDVNDPIKLVKKKEVRKQGKASQAHGAFEENEYEHLIKKVKSSQDHGDEVRLFLSAIFRLEYNLIARIDDSAKFRCDNLKRNPEHEEYSLIGRLCWSKLSMNTVDEK